MHNMFRINTAIKKYCIWDQHYFSNMAKSDHFWFTRQIKVGFSTKIYNWFKKAPYYIDLPSPLYGLIQQMTNCWHLFFLWKKALIFYVNCLLFPENRFWYFMQIVSLPRRQFAWNAKAYFLRKIRTIFQNVVCWIFPQSVKVNYMVKLVSFPRYRTTDRFASVYWEKKFAFPKDSITKAQQLGRAPQTLAKLHRLNILQHILFSRRNKNEIFIWLLLPYWAMVDIGTSISPNKKDIHATFLVFPWKYMLWVLIRSTSLRCF